MPEPTTTAATATGDRLYLLGLAHSVANGGSRARKLADELVPLTARVPDSLTLFDQLVAAVAAGSDVEALLDRLVGA